MNNSEWTIPREHAFETIALTAFAYHATSRHESANPDPVCPNSFHTQVFWLDNISFQDRMYRILIKGMTAKNNSKCLRKCYSYDITYDNDAI